ncbi:hypothetical protein EJP82_13705 [Paenibacillus anaericanus]|uniref:Uncharacterized protein n=1 Tax=Paenibacillus anaericanus TaxID=170367 RepID=A0A3S1DSB7_9BACL|nr:hypothetical protein [Paenibacillus anaericanus]RUT46170.1 hypothetical protein EJP82_13705 [Paenibacillus anaericanus]
MSLQGQSQNQVIYRADENSIRAMRGIKNQVHQLGNQYANHPIRVQTVDGITYEGRLSHMDGDHMFLIIPGTPMHGHNGWNGGHQGWNPGGHQGWHQGWHQGGHHDGHHDGHHNGHHDGHHGGHHGGHQYPGLGQQGHHPQSRAFFGGPGAGFNDVILPLVLYNLLVISLL